MLLTLAAVQLPRWRLASSRPGIPAPNQRGHAWTGARVWEEPLWDRERARLCVPLPHFSSQGKNARMTLTLSGVILMDVASMSECTCWLGFLETTEWSGSVHFFLCSGFMKPVLIWTAVRSYVSQQGAVLSLWCSCQRQLNSREDVVARLISLLKWQCCKYLIRIAQAAMSVSATRKYFGINQPTSRQRLFSISDHYICVFFSPNELSS